jgi:hypothetical protein
MIPPDGRPADPAPTPLAGPPLRDLAPPPGRRLRLQTEPGGAAVLVLASGRVAQILPGLLPLIAAAFFIWNAERSHQHFLARVPERDRAFFSSGPRPLLFFSPFLIVPGAIFVGTAIVTLRQTRLRFTSKDITLSSSLLGTEFGRRSFARPNLIGIRLQRIGPDVPSYTLAEPASGEARREAAGRIHYRSNTVLVGTAGEHKLANNLTPEEGQWLREAMRALQLPEIPDTTGIAQETEQR